MRSSWLCQFSHHPWTGRSWSTSSASPQSKWHTYYAARGEGRRRKMLAVTRRSGRIDKSGVQATRNPGTQEVEAGGLETQAWLHSWLEASLSHSRCRMPYCDPTSLRLTLCTESTLSGVRGMEGWRDGSVGEGACYQAQQPDFSL